MGKSKSSKSIRKKEIVSTQFPVAQNLLKWYDRNRRDLPWRESTDPYRVWLSEIMLQQTRVNQAIDYYFRFLKAFPRIEDLADAREQVVLKLWQGLGYYSRARNLHGAAKQVVNEYGGVFPSKYHEINSLKGVGPYTAAAIGSISFGIPEPAVDGNALRVMSRFFGIHTPVNSPAGFNQVKEKMLSVIDQQRPGDFNQAVMELGATLCAPRNPDCAHCPLSAGCLANANQLTDVLPLKKAKKPPVPVELRYLVVRYNDNVYLRQRGTGAIWANMFDFPELSAGESGADLAAIAFDQLKIFKPTYIMVSEPVIHLLTHRRIEVTFIECVLTSRWTGAPAGVKAVAAQRLSEYPVPVVVARYLKQRIVEESQSSSAFKWRTFVPSNESSHTHGKRKQSNPDRKPRKGS